jgi:hypothetical protein
MIVCNPQLNQYEDNIQTYIYVVKKKKRDKFSICTSRIFFFKYTHLHRSIFVHFFSSSSSSLLSQTDNRLCWVKYVDEIKRLTKESYYPQTILRQFQIFLCFCSKKKKKKEHFNVYIIDKSSIKIQVECVRFSKWIRKAWSVTLWYFLKKIFIFFEKEQVCY